MIFLVCSDFSGAWGCLGGFCFLRSSCNAFIMADKTSSTLPLSRVKTIMKSSPDVSSISQEALYTTGKATVCDKVLMRKGCENRHYNMQFPF